MTLSTPEKIIYASEFLVINHLNKKIEISILFDGFTYTTGEKKIRRDTEREKIERKFSLKNKEIHA